MGYSGEIDVDMKSGGDQPVESTLFTFDPDTGSRTRDPVLRHRVLRMTLCYMGEAKADASKLTIQRGRTMETTSRFRYVTMEVDCDVMLISSVKGGKSELEARPVGGSLLWSEVACRLLVDGCTSRQAVSS